MPSYTDTLRARAKALWPDEKGLYCYVRNAEYDKAFESGVFPREIALTRQAEYKASVASKFAEVNGDKPIEIPEHSADLCILCKRPIHVQDGLIWHDHDNSPASLRCESAKAYLPAPIPESPVESREESKPVRDYAINPDTGKRRKPKTCQYCSAYPVYWFEPSPGKYALVHADGKPCSEACASRHRVMPDDADQDETQPKPAKGICKCGSDMYQDDSLIWRHCDTHSAAAEACPHPGEARPPKTKLEAALTQPANLTNTPKSRAQLIAELLDQPQQLDEQQIRAIIKQELSRENRVTVDMRVQINDLPIIDCKDQHERFGLLVILLSARIPTMLVGPAGSGKTTACHRAAEALTKDFRMIACGPIPQEAALIGYMDAVGKYVRTPLRDAYEQGGVFLFDELDAAHPGTVVKLNALLANDVYTFPDGECMRRHADFIPVAAANTFGTGADRQYVGRNQLDAATLDRFFVLEWGYDWQFTLQLAGLPTHRKPVKITPSGYTAQSWLTKVQKIHAYISSKAIRHVCGPRAALYGIKLLDALPANLLDDGLLYKGLSAVQRQEIERAIQ